ncbi:MAG: hypothetical protein GKR97_00285 [Rhizobiaceae bacterium]|nr:hypothetical protein [Rhizobiaceae bacterium]
MTENQPRLPAIGAAMLVLLASQLASIYLQLSIFNYIAMCCVFVIGLLARRLVKIREFYLIAVGGILAVVAWVTSQHAVEWMIEGLSRSAYLASFILLMALLREGALTSRSVVDLGRYLTFQPPKRRFVAVFSGAHMLSAMINLGALPLFAPIIQRGVRADLPATAPLDEVAQIRERRQLTATLRGFSWFLIWAPTAVTQAIMPTLMDGIQALRLMGIGLCIALIMMLLGWCEDWLRWRKTGHRIRQQGMLGTIETPNFPRNSARNFALVCALLFVLSVGFYNGFGVSIVSGVMLAAPIVVLVWVVVQQPSGSKLSGTATRFDQITHSAMPGYVREMLFVACAGFIGTIGAKLVPIAEFAQAIGLATAPGWSVLFTLSMSVWVFGQVGFSPITMAVFLSSVVAQIPVLPVDITHAALAIAAGTAICTTGAPFSAGALMLSRATGYSPFTLTWRWNGLFTFLSMIVLTLIYVWLEPGQ